MTLLLDVHILPLVLWLIARIAAKITSPSLIVHRVARRPAKITKAPPMYPVAPMVSSGMNWNARSADHKGTEE